MSRTLSKASSYQSDFWPELASKSMVTLARLAGARASARRYEDGRAGAGRAAVRNPALNPDSFALSASDADAFDPVNPDSFGGRRA
ncbi:hypothetical protein [Hydrogenophaga sp. NFH-34]|uniref:hypothetical protein n=1 Tax=Hydrogenophaga sp. NFH-34 TaxID=2744446 RepID=UPI001F1B0697|nr:hypothetical protein [Hydrogenophaga sp. NFH-34]